MHNCTIICFSFSAHSSCHISSESACHVCIQRTYEKRKPYGRKGFDIHIPGGLATWKTDWYPFVMTFVDNKGFQSYMGNKNLSLTILYNFPAFSLLNGCSRLFDENLHILMDFMEHILSVTAVEKAMVLILTETLIKEK